MFWFYALSHLIAFICGMLAMALLIGFGRSAHNSGRGK